MNLKCAGCSKAHADVRVLVALSDGLNLCNECVDLAVEVCAHAEFGGDGTVKVALKELEALRAQAHQGVMAKIWTDGIRKSIAHLDGMFPADAPASTPQAPA